jgi:hypothetical protein
MCRERGHGDAHQNWARITQVGRLAGRPSGWPADLTRQGGYGHFASRVGVLVGGFCMHYSRFGVVWTRIKYKPNSSN